MTATRHNQDYTISPETQELAADILGYFEQFPGRHTQDEWFYANGDKAADNDPLCGTTCCVAGASVLLTADERFKFFTVAGANNMLLIEEGDYSFAYAGRENLGLNYFDAFLLFYCTTNEQALTALGYLAEGKRPAWDQIFTERAYNHHVRAWDKYLALEAEEYFAS